jgi:hypothetical protein
MREAVEVLARGDPLEVRQPARKYYVDVYGRTPPAIPQPFRSFRGPTPIRR